MPSPLQDILAAAAVGCAVMSAIYNDRMAKELRETGEARYADPRLTPGRQLSRRKSDLEFNHEQRFTKLDTAKLENFYQFVCCPAFCATDNAHRAPASTNATDSIFAING
jgi:hypothetical protein